MNLLSFSCPLCTLTEINKKKYHPMNSTMPDIEKRDLNYNPLMPLSLWKLFFLYPKQVFTPKQFLTVRRDKKSLYSFVCLPMHLQIGSFVKSSLVWLRTIGDNTQDSVQGWYMYILDVKCWVFHTSNHTEKSLRNLLLG